MPEQIVALSPSKHRNLALKKNRNYTFARDRIFVPVWGVEFSYACQSFPLGFYKQDAGWTPVAVTGLRPNENLFVNAGGRWLGEYIPATLRAHPFVMANKEGKSDPVVGIFEDDPLLVETAGTPGPELEPLFTAQGEPAPLVLRIKDFLDQLNSSKETTRTLLHQLEMMELLTPWELQCKDPDSGQPINVRGLHKIDEARLNSLDDESFLTLRQKQALPFIYAHLLSTRLVFRLEKLLRIGAHKKGKQAEVEQDLKDILVGDDELFKFD